MKKITAIAVSFLLFHIFYIPAYAKKYSHEYRYYRYNYESLRPLIWAGAVYIGILGLKELIFIPEEKSMKEKELELVNLEIEKKRRENDFSKQIYRSCLVREIRRS